MFWKRAVLRLCGVKFSRDGSRVTMPRKHEQMLDAIVENVVAAGWRERHEIRVSRVQNQVFIDGNDGKSVELRLV